MFSVGQGDASGTPSVNPQIQVGKPPTTGEEPLHAELQSFLEGVQARSRPAVTLEDGRRALAVALDIVSSIGEHGRRINLERLHA